MTDLFFITGAPAVGKSTTAHAVAARFKRSLHIPVDDLREMVVSGKVLPGEDWNQELVDQLRLARQTAVQMALIYRGVGYTIAIDDFWDPYNRLNEYDLLFAETRVHKIFLLPDLEAAKTRNIKRSQSEEGNEYIEAGIRLVYEHLNNNEVTRLIQEGWKVVDTSDKTIDATVDHILGLT